MPYSSYNYDAVFTQPFSDEAVGQDLKCAYKTVTVKAGVMLEIKAFPSFLDRTDYSRAKKYRPSTKAQQELNERNARRKQIRTLNANFTTRDLWGTYGWDSASQPHSLEEAKHEVVKFIARLNYALKKRGLPSLRYMYVVESGKGNPDKGEPEVKYHVHMVMSAGLERDVIESLWHGGAYPQTRRLVVKDFGGLTGLGTYITKQANGKRRWGQSKGLKPWTRGPRESFSKFSKAKVRKMVEAVQRGDSLKAMFEKAYPGYGYRDDYPCEIRRNEEFGGYYLYCRMYRV